MFKELLEKRNRAEEQYIRIDSLLPFLWNDYYDAQQEIKKEFIRQKLYISIDEFPKYLKENKALSFTVVYSNKETEDLFYTYGLFYRDTVYEEGKIVPCKIIMGETDNKEETIIYDINECEIIGFYDLVLVGGQKVKETFMEEIIKDKE